MATITIIKSKCIYINFFSVLLIKPSNILTAIPLPSFPNSMNININAVSMLLAIAPLSLVLPAIAPNKFANPVLLIIEMLADVFLTIRPLHSSLPIHPIGFPVPLIDFPIPPPINPIPLDLVSLEIAFKGTPIAK